MTIFVSACIILVVLFVGMAFYSMFEPSDGNSGTYENVGKSNTDRNIENIERMQNYNFWRDFDKEQLK